MLPVTARFGFFAGTRRVHLGTSSAPLGWGRDRCGGGECEGDRVVVVGGDNAAGGRVVRPVELARVRARLVAFAEEMLASLPRSDQRRWGAVYLRGLMLDGKRKSIEPMAGRLPDGDEQCLQQFVNQSPWEWQPVRRRLARRLSTAIVPEAWIIDDTSFPKFGRESVGVARQYCGALGKVANCQVGVSINAASDEASCPLDWRLFLPEEWDDDRERRAKTQVPVEERHRPKWRLALEMLDGLRDDGLEPSVVLGDGGYGEISELRLALEQREFSYVLQVKGGTSAYPPDARREAPAYNGTGRPPKPRYRARRSSLRTLARAAGRGPCRRSLGARARGASSPRSFSRCGCGRRTSSCAVLPARTSCRSPGSSASGPMAPTSRSSIGFPTCPKRRRSSGSSRSRSCAGGSSTTTAS